MHVFADLSTGLNALSEVERYPLFLPRQTFNKINGGKTLIKLDLKEAFVQISLDKESSKLVVISAHEGLYQYMRSGFGVASALGIFLQFIDMVLEGCAGAGDDIVITGKDEVEHSRCSSLPRIFSRQT